MVLGRLKEIDGVFKKTVRLYDTRCPSGVFINDLNGEIYVPDRRSIKVFASNGNYLRTISLKSGMLSYCISSHGIILCTTSNRKEKE